MDKEFWTLQSEYHEELTRSLRSQLAFPGASLAGSLLFVRTDQTSDFPLYYVLLMSAAALSIYALFLGYYVQKLCSLRMLQLKRRRVVNDNPSFKVVGYLDLAGPRSKLDKLFDRYLRSIVFGADHSSYDGTLESFDSFISGPAGRLTWVNISVGVLLLAFFLLYVSSKYALELPEVLTFGLSDAN